MNYSMCDVKEELNRILYDGDLTEKEMQKEIIELIEDAVTDEREDLEYELKDEIDEIKTERDELKEEIDELKAEKQQEQMIESFYKYA